MRNKYFTKSRFKLALECVTKLYYTGKKEEYSDKTLDDPFLEALAKGGYQVGELAKYYFCDDPVKEKITIDTLDYEESLKRTDEMLSRPGKVVIAEAAFKFKNLFVRVDLLVKDGDTIYIYEVKAKSIGAGDSFLNAKGTAVTSKWVEYLYDIAYQRYVVSNSLKEKNIAVKTHLMLVNKDEVTSVDGLNQYFKVFAEGRRIKVVIKDGVSRKDLGTQILLPIPTDDVCDKIQNDFPVQTDYAENISFEDFIWKTAEIYEKNVQEFTPVGSKCKACSFYTEHNDPMGLKSGFNECWQISTGLKSLLRPLVTDLWNGLAGARSYADELVKINKHFIHLVNEEDIAAKTQSKKTSSGLIPHERRMEQINRVKENTNESYFDGDGLKREMESWKFPLHMIDFETSSVAIPFFKGLHPYEGVAFQFSHHTIDENWKIKHATQYISFELGKFPNFEFVQNLKDALSKDKGTIFRYHNHENTYLNFITRQLRTHPSAPPNKKELIEFINGITHDKAEERWGERDMVDMYDLVLRYYYPPFAKGSNSLKQILPAIILESDFLKDKYGKSGVYGKGKEVESLNFEDHIWISPDKNNNPYETLPRVFQEYDPETLDLLVRDFDNLADGGSAMTAYNYLQFSEIPEGQRQSIRDSLFRYCELDTMAMVMLLEGWKEMIK